MAFTIYYNPQGISEPRFQCDTCGKLIEFAEHAILVWDNPWQEKGVLAVGTVTPRVVCKGRCDRDADNLNKLSCSMELNTAMVFLLRNTNMEGQKLDRAKAKARIISSIG